MARPIVLSNGSLHVGINHFGMVHDFYYPYVGFENHAAAKSLRHRVGVWTEEGFSWLDDGSWIFQFDYHDRTLVGRTIATHGGLGVQLEMDDAVDAVVPAFLRNIRVVNQWDRPRTVKLFLHQVFVISNSYYADTAQYLPDDQAILHYKGPRSFIVDGTHSDGRGFDQFCVGVHGIEGYDGSYRDAEDGWLSGNMVEHGSVDSVIGYDLALEALDGARVAYWITAGTTLQEARQVHQKISNDGVVSRIIATSKYWHRWLRPALPAIAKLPAEYQESFTKSLLIAKTQIDQGGAVIASTDTTMLNYSRDAYTFCWPRDSAYVIWPLVRLGFVDEPLAFFDFCRGVLQPGGFFMHKYNADGSLGSSWHPYHLDGTHVSQPIQEDETAIVLFVFAQYYRQHADRDVLERYYATLVEPMANFLSSFVDPTTKLPLPSYDLWERLYQTSTYTVGAVYGALTEAAYLADKYDRAEDALRWSTVADDIRHAAHLHLYNAERRCFVKGVVKTPDGLEADTAVDMSSVYGAIMFGLFDMESDEVRASMATVHEVLATSTIHPALARFENDDYDRRNPEHIGNPWFITTLWAAQYAHETDQRQLAIDLVSWVRDHMLASGVLSEQFDPETLQFISVAPLAWSQAEYVSSLLDIFVDTPAHEKHL